MMTVYCDRTDCFFHDEEKETGTLSGHCLLSSIVIGRARQDANGLPVCMEYRKPLEKKEA